MPPIRKGKSWTSANNSTAAGTTQQKKKPLPMKPPAKTKSSATNMAATAGMKSGQTTSPGALQEKRSKTRPLTAADIPDIVSAVVKAMPQSTKASTTRAPRQSSRVSCSRVTATMPTAEVEDSSDDEDIDNEDFGK